MINFEQKLPFRMHVGKAVEGYESLVKKQINRRWYNSGENVYKLYTEKDRFLPFQAFIPIDYGAHPFDAILDTLTLFDCEGNVILIDDELDEYPFEFHQVYGVGVWIIYKGEPIPSLNLDGGYYYFALLTEFGRYVVSEIFYVPCEESEWADLTKIEFWNVCDIGNVIYQTGYKNKFWVNATLLKNTPTIEETGFENGFGEFQLEFSRYVDNYSLNDYVPEFILNTFLFMQMNDNVFISTADTNQRGKMMVKKVTPSWDNMGGFCELNVDFEQEIRLVKGSCCSNMKFTSVIQLVANDDEFMLDANLYSTLTTVFNSNLMTNDTGDPSKFVQTDWITTTLGGSAQMFANGTFQYMKPSGVAAPFIDTFNYTIEDAFGTTSTAVVKIKVNIATPIADHFYVFVNTLEQTNGQPMNVLTNDFIPVTYGYVPKIYYTGGLIDTQRKQLFDTGGSGNYIYLNVFTGEVEAFNPAGKLPIVSTPDIYSYQLYNYSGGTTPAAEIKISWE